MFKNIALVVISLVVSGVFVALALRGVPVEEVLANIGQANPFWVIMAIALGVVAVWTRGIRWRGLLNYKVSQNRAFYIVGITYLLNLLPLRAGEVARSLLARREGVPLATAATSIIVERLLDTLLVVVMLSVSVSQLPNIPDSVSTSALLFGVAGIAAAITGIFMAKYRGFSMRILAVVEARLTFLQRFNLSKLLEQVLDGLQPLTEPRRLAHAIGWTLISWTFSVLMFYALHLGLSLSGPDAMVNSALGTALASFSIAIPVSVASIGPFQGAVRLAGEMVGLASVQAISLGFILHGVAVASYIITGVIGIIALGVGVSDFVDNLQKRVTPVQQSTTPVQS
ncbi:MAG: flippase-like domain-containing protein [Chloroflexi bacterium]|nr:flippase-like domain-containing protein [Chloroflexota bacterium]